MQKKLRRHFNNLFPYELEHPEEFLDDLLLLSSADDIVEACMDWGCDSEPAAKFAQLMMR